MDDLIKRAEAIVASDDRHFYTVDALMLMREILAALRRVTEQRDNSKDLLKAALAETSRLVPFEGALRRVTAERDALKAATEPSDLRRWRRRLGSPRPAG